jgi:hypothetical protein
MGVPLRQTAEPVPQPPAGDSDGDDDVQEDAASDRDVSEEVLINAHADYELLMENIIAGYPDACHTKNTGTA